jgi:hypothetical protein
LLQHRVGWNHLLDQLWVAHHRLQHLLELRTLHHRWVNSSHSSQSSQSHSAHSAEASEASHARKGVLLRLLGLWGLLSRLLFSRFLLLGLNHHLILIIYQPSDKWTSSLFCSEISHPNLSESFLSVYFHLLFIPLNITFKSSGFA